MKEDAVSVLFDQPGAKQFAAGKVREALSIDRGLIDAHPNDPLPHIRMAYALMAAGVGEEARAEALKATVLAPKSALAFSALGWMLQFNAIGVRLGRGFDLHGALAAYRTSKSLDPEDLQTRSNLAFLSEYDANGGRYTSVEGLKAAIQEYRDLAKLDSATGEQYEDNLLFDLLYSHQYKELLSEVETLPGSDIRNSLGISATVAAEGVDAGLKRADRLSADSAQRSSHWGLRADNFSPCACIPRLPRFSPQVSRDRRMPRPWLARLKYCAPCSHTRLLRPRRRLPRVWSRR